MESAEQYGCKVGNSSLNPAPALLVPDKPKPNFFVTLNARATTSPASDWSLIPEIDLGNRSRSISTVRPTIMNAIIGNMKAKTKGARRSDRVMREGSNDGSSCES